MAQTKSRSSSRKKKSLQDIAREVLSIEALAIQGIIPKIDSRFDRAVALCIAIKGRVIITGMGKAGLIGRKIAATMASTGTPSLFMHPAEAIHGDLGMVTSQDLVIAISNSGETEEIVRLLSIIKKLGIHLIGMSGNPKSTLAREADVSLDISISREACPLGLAPTASTTVALAMGDALSVALQHKKNFKVADFARFHPGGALGRKLLRVSDLMRTAKGNPVVFQDKTVQEALRLITLAKAGSCSIVDKQGKLKGIFTDGDLRRYLNSNKESILDQPIGKFATKQVKKIGDDRLAAEAVRIMEEAKIDELPVVNKKGQVVGLLDVQDLLKAGFI